MEKKKKPFYKKWWFWLIVVVVIGVAGSGEGEAPESSDVKTQGESEVAQSDNASAEKVSTDQTKEEQKEEEEEKNDVPTEYKSALKRAKNYISDALTAMLDLGKGSGPMQHNFDLQGEYAKEVME